MADPVLVLGAAGGIGSAVAETMSEHGRTLILAGRTAGALEKLAERTGGVAHVIDATNVDAVEALVDNVTKTHGHLTGIVNCVGSLLLKPAHLTSTAEWSDTVNTNLTSAFAVTRAAGRHMRSSGGAVVLMSSAAARVGLANHEAIAAAKAGIIGLAKAAATSYAKSNIRFNVIAPGLVETGLTERITRSDAGRKTSMDMHALGRLGKPSDVASAITWLLDPNNDWITGQVFGVDGGLSSVRA